MSNNETPLSEEEEDQPTKGDNPLDEGLAFGIKTIISPTTELQRQRLGHTHREFTVNASACREIDNFLQSLVPPLRSTGRPLYKRLRLLTGFSMNVYDSSQSASGHLVIEALDKMSPGLVRQSIPGLGLHGLSELSVGEGPQDIKYKKKEQK